MYARVTQFDIDPLAMSMPRAIARFNEQILPELREQAGYSGVSVLYNEEGRGLLISYWESEAAAGAALASGFYDEQVRKFVTFYRQQPGREQYQVGVFEAPAPAALELVRGG